MLRYKAIDETLTSVSVGGSSIEIVDGTFLIKEEDAGALELISEMVQLIETDVPAPKKKRVQAAPEGETPPPPPPPSGETPPPPPEAPGEGAPAS